MNTVHTVRAEWAKLRTVVSTSWLMVAAVATTVAVGAVVTFSAGSRDCLVPQACLGDVPRLSLTGAGYGQVAVVVLAVLVMGDEYGTRLIGPTLTAVPHRWRMYAAKAAVLTATVIAVASIGVLGSLLVARHVLPGTPYSAANGDPGLSLADEPTLRATYGTVVYLALVALLSYGVTTVLRDTAGSIATMLTLLYAGPILSSTIGPWHGLGVLALWSTGALAAGLLTLHVRDA